MSKLIEFNYEYYKNFFVPHAEEYLKNLIYKDGKYFFEYDKKELCMERNNTEKKIIGLSMFSGAGGLDIGAYLAGIDILYTLDIDKDSVETLKRNKIFDVSLHEEGDIRNIEISKLKEILTKNAHDYFILIGGPPCQPFSKAGYWVKNENRDSFNDKRNMIPAHFNVIDNLHPDAVVLENVESILHPSNSEAVEYIKSGFDKLGYYLTIKKINSADFGVPQKRKRVFFIATKKCISFDLIPTHNKNGDLGLLRYSSVADWIVPLNETFKPIDGKWAFEISEIPPGQNYIALTSKREHPNPRFIAGKRYWNSLLKLDPLQPSCTILASPGHWEGPFHWENRRITNKEAAAIQTFPTNYVFEGSERSVRRQIGNAVPPLLSKIIFEELIRCIIQ